MGDFNWLALVALGAVLVAFAALVWWLWIAGTPQPAESAPVPVPSTTSWLPAAESTWDHGTDMKRALDGYGTGLVPVPRQRWVEPVTAEIVAERVHTCPLCAPIAATADALLYEATAADHPINLGRNFDWARSYTRYLRVLQPLALPGPDRDYTGSWAVVAA